MLNTAHTDTINFPISSNSTLATIVSDYNADPGYAGSLMGCSGVNNGRSIDVSSLQLQMSGNDFNFVRSYPSYFTLFIICS